MESKKSKKLLCSIHNDSKIRLFQVNGIENNKNNQKLFYCLDCLQSDNTFDSSKYFQFKKFIKSNIFDQVNPQWPPWTDSEFLKNYIQLELTEEEIDSYENEVIKYFGDFKDELIKDIDISLKKCLEQIRSLKANKKQLIEKYVELTKIQELQNILANTEMETQEMEQKYRELLFDVTSMSYKITDELTNYANELKNDKIFNCEKANTIKSQVLKSISEIDFLTLPQTISINPSYQNVISKFQFAEYDSTKKILRIQDEIVRQGISNNKDNSILIIDTEKRQSFCCNTILNEENYYIFRIQILSIENEQICSFGLTFNKELDEPFNYIICKLKYSNNQISNENSNYFVQKKGEGLVLSEERMIEMRVNIKQQILEISDYPHYHYEMKIADGYKNKLIQKNLRLFFDLQKKQIVNLREAYIVNNFN